MKKIDWKTFYTLLAGAVISVGAVMPYILSVFADELAQSPIPLHIGITIQLVQAAFMFALALYAGLRLLPKTNFSVWPDRAGHVKILIISVLCGTVSGLFAKAGDALWLRFGYNPLFGIRAESWKALLGSLYGAVGEEILLRLFLVTLLTWLISRVPRMARADGMPRGTAEVTAVVLAALVFGLVHLVPTAALADITPLIVSRALILNGVPGVVFGLLYRRYGLVAGMYAHFAADVVFHVL